LKLKWILLAGLFCAMTGVAAPRPDFTGTWKLNNERSERDGPADRVYILEIQQQKSTIQITTKATPPPTGIVLEGTFKIGTQTSKPVVEHPNGHYHSTRVFWENTTLVFEVIDREGSGVKSKATNVIRESWVLAGDGKTFTKFRRTPGSGKIVDQKYVFEKQ
jgi:hypothetical protein